MSIELSGFDEFERKLGDLERKLDEVDGEHDVPASELFNDDFMRRNTQFQTFQAMCDAGGVETKEEIAGDGFSQFIGTHSRFSGWSEMIQAAGAEWAKRKIGF